MPFDPDVMFPPSKFTVKRHVALLDEHKAKDPKGGKDFPVTRELLEEIAANCNERVNETGDASPHIIGHTIPGVHESKQGDILGYWANFRVDDFFDTGRKALFGDFYVLNDKLEEAKKYPRRSVELWKRQKILDPICGLKASTPERSLGLLLFHRDDESPYRYSIQDPQESSMDNPTDPNTMAAAFATSQPFTEVLQQVEGFAAKMVAQDQKIDALTQQLTGAMSVLGNIQQIMDALSDEYDQENPSDDPRDLLGPADPEPAPAAAAAPASTPTQGDRSGPVRFDSSASGPNSGYVPGPVSKEKVQMQRDDDEAVQFQKAVDAEVTKRTAAAEREKKALLDRLAAAEENIVQFQRDARAMKAEKAITELETKHDVDFGDFRDNELAMLTELDDESFQYEFDRVQKYWRKKEKPLPNDGKEVEAVKFQRTDEKPLIASFEDSQRAIKEAAAKGLSYEQYVAKITAK